MSTEAEEKDSNGFGVFLLLFPVILIGAISSVAGYIAARNGSTRPVVRALLFPANFIISNFIGVMVLLSANLVYAAAKNGRDSMLYDKLGDYLDLTLFVIWGRFIGWFYSFSAGSEAYSINVPIWHIAVFQLLLWGIVGNLVAKAWTDSVMWLAGRR